MASLGKCNKCGKTVYQIEGVTCGPPTNTQVFHKGCFKCMNPGCNWQLTLTSYKFFDGKVYCANHNPMTGFSNADHASGTRVTDDVDIKNATNAPKRDVINEQVRGGEHKNTQVLDMAGQTAKNAPKLGVINEQIRTPLAKK